MTPSKLNDFHAVIISKPSLNSKVTHKNDNVHVHIGTCTCTVHTTSRASLQ